MKARREVLEARLKVAQKELEEILVALDYQNNPEVQNRSPYFAIGYARAGVEKVLEKISGKDDHWIVERAKLAEQ